MSDAYFVRTLVVDDDLRIAALHAAAVERTSGFAVCGQAHSVASAVEAIQATQPDLVLLDIQMPDGSGFDVISRPFDQLQQQQPDFIVITAARDIGTADTAMELGVAGYLIKPFGLDMLREQLCSYLMRRQRFRTSPGGVTPELSATSEDFDDRWT